MKKATSNSPDPVRWRPAKTLVASLALVLGAVSTATTYAEEPSNDAGIGEYETAKPEPGMLDRASLESSEYKDEDIQALAERYELSLDDAALRMRLEDSLTGRLTEWESAIGDDYAGAWVEEDGLGVSVGVVKGSDWEQARVAEAVAFPYPEYLKLEEVPRSLSDLQEIMNALIAERQDAKNTDASQDQAGKSLTDELGTHFDVGMRQTSNIIHVFVAEGVDVEAAQALLDDRFGRGATDILRGVVQPNQTSGCAPQFDCRPSMLGGLATIRNSARRCTFGFTAIRYSQHGVLSAGHCDGIYRGHGVPTSYNTYGEVTDEQFWGMVDGEFIDRTDSASNYGKVIDSNSGTYRNISYYRDVNDYPEGVTVGMTGQKSGVERGAITHTIYTPSGTGYSSYHYGYVRADYCSDGGDSGGPVWRHGIAMGLHSGSPDTACYGVFTRIEPTMDELNVSLLGGGSQWPV